MPIGQKIQSLILEKNITQNCLSKKCGISQSYLNELINGKYNNPSIIILKKIASALDTTVTNLVDENVS